MRKYFLLVLLAAFSAACSLDENFEKEKGNPDDLQLNPGNPSVEGSDDGIDQSVFSLLNLDYSGLEAVKAHYENQEYYLAAYELLQYYRNRVDVFNPDVVFNPDYTSSELNMADQATSEGGYRFYVRNYSENQGEDGVQGTADDTYWSFKTEDGSINWELVPSGYESEQEWRSQKHRLQWMLPQAKVYAATKDEKYAEAWMSILESWMGTYTNHKNEDGSFVVFPEGSSGEAIPWTGLQPAERLTALISSFMYYVNSESITPEFLCRVLVFIYDHMGNMLANPWYDHGSNIELSQQQSILLGGMYMPEFRDAATWLDKGAQMITAQLTGQFHADGVHNEFDLSYHIGVVSNFVTIYNAAKLNNKLGLFPSDYTSYLKNACLWVQDMTYPDYTVEGFNDTRVARTQGNVIVKNLKEYNLMFPDGGEFLYMSSKRAYGSPVSTDLRLYPESGYYVFRSGWETKDIMLIVKNNNDPDKMWHNQPDNGTIGLYRNGRRFMPDAGVSSYGGDSESNSLRTTFAATSMHSTMNVDKKDVEKRAGQLLASGKYSNIEYLVTENQSYSNLTHRRAVFFVDKKFFVIVDEGYGDGAVNNVQLVFMLSDWIKSENNVQWDAENTSPFTAHTAYSDNNNMVYRTFTSGGIENYRSEGNSGYYLNDVTTPSDYNTDRIQRALYRVTVDKPASKAARFITVIYPIGAASEFDSLQISARFTDNQVGDFNAGGAQAEVTVNGTTYSLIYTLN